MDNDVKGKTSIFQKASGAFLGAIDKLAGRLFRGMGKDPNDFDKVGVRFVLAMVAAMVAIVAGVAWSLIAYAPSQGGQKGSAPEKQQEIPAQTKKHGTGARMNSTEGAPLQAVGYLRHSVEILPAGDRCKQPTFCRKQKGAPFSVRRKSGRSIAQLAMNQGETAKKSMAFGIRPMARTPYAKGTTPDRKNANVV